MKTNLVIYHYPCMDGFTAAWAAWKALGDTADYVRGTYGSDDDLPNVFDKDVYIVDFSYPYDQMKFLASRAKSITVLDHHKSAKENLLPLLESGIVKGEFDMNRSGAGMSWDFFHPDKVRPRFVDYVEDHDLWRHNLPYSAEINMAMYAYKYDFNMWDTFVDGLSTLKQEGVAVYRAHMKNVRELTENQIVLNIGGYSVPAVNANYFFGSQVGEILCEGKPFAAYFWMNKEGKYVFGLRSNDKGIDVAEVAQSYGGGGHEKASGFRVDKLEDL